MIFTFCLHSYTHWTTPNIGKHSYFTFTYCGIYEYVGLDLWLVRLKRDLSNLNKIMGILVSGYSWCVHLASNLGQRIGLYYVLLLFVWSLCLNGYGGVYDDGLKIDVLCYVQREISRVGSISRNRLFRIGVCRCCRQYLENRSSQSVSWADI